MIQKIMARMSQWLVLYLLIALPMQAQQAVVMGDIRDDDKNPMQKVSVQLLRTSDNIAIKQTISDSLGLYSFYNVAPGQYFARATYVGMETTASKTFEVQAAESTIFMEPLYLKHSESNLQTVTVVKRKAQYEQKTDRLVVNLKNSPTAATGSALDVLSKSPGVIVDRQNASLTMNGKNGVSVMINGKMTYMPTDALIQFLSGIPATNIERIELITTPPAKFDAGGNGGVINIVMVSNPNTGFNGSYFLTAGLNSKWIGAAGANANYRNARLNLFGSYTFNDDHYVQPLTGFTQFTRGENIVTNNSFSNRDATQRVHNMRIGLDYQFDSKTIIGCIVGGYDSRWTMIAQNGATITQSHGPDTLIRTVNNPELNHWQNLMTNMNVQHTFKPHQVLYLDASYIYYRDNNPNNYSTDYFTGNGQLISHEELRSGKITPIRFLVYSGNFTTSLGHQLTMEAGAKWTGSEFNNDLSVEKWNGSSWIPQSGLTTNYSLKENIAAAFASLTLAMDKNVSISAGLRYEYTTSTLGTEKTANISDRNYGELFPTLYVSRKIDEKNSTYFSYSRRITRPTFNDLAPFSIFFDPKTFYAGNPFLQPAIANSLQVGYSFQNYNLSVAYTHETNTIDNSYFQTQRIDSVTGIVYLAARNFNYEKYLTVNFSFPLSITKWWSMQNNVTGNWRDVSTGSGKETLRWQYTYVNLNTTQRFRFPADFSLELTGMYMSAGYLGTAKRKPVYQVDAGIQKKLANQRDVLRLVVNDIFNSGGENDFSETLPASGARVDRTFNYGLYAIKLSFTHDFGNRSLKNRRERSIGSEEELKRVNY